MAQLLGLGPGRHRVAAFTCAALSGALLALSFPSLGYPAAAWVALTPLLVILYGIRSLRLAFGLGLTTGAVHFAGTLPWLAQVMIEHIRQAKVDKDDITAGLTAVVTLEPCNHTGRTGPCSEALLAAGIGAVHYAVADPGDASSGGAARLAAAGVPATHGPRTGEGEALLVETMRQHQGVPDLAERGAKSAILSMRLAMGLAADDKRCLEVGLCGLLHDLGMLKVSEEAIRGKRLDEAGIELLKRHPIESQRILEDFGPVFARVGRIVV